MIAIVHKLKVTQMSYGLYVVVLSMLLAISAHIQVPFLYVPVTMQTLAVILIGGLVSPRVALATVGAYLLEGFFGLPVFAYGGGSGYLMGPTGGYLFGMLIAAPVCSWLNNSPSHNHFLASLRASAMTVLLINVCGLIWLTHTFGFISAVLFGVTPFVAVEFVKMLIGTVALWSIRTSGLRNL